MTDRELLELAAKAAAGKLYEQNPSRGCKTCPHTIGDAYQRDCAYPDCSPDLMPPTTAPVNNEDALREALSGALNMLEKYVQSRNKNSMVRVIDMIDTLKNALSQPAQPSSWIPASQSQPAPQETVPVMHKMLETIDGLRITADKIDAALKRLKGPSATDRDEAYVITAASVMSQVLRDRAAISAPIAQPVAWWDRGAGSFYLNHSHIPPHIQPDRITPLYVAQDELIALQSKAKHDRSEG